VGEINMLKSDIKLLFPVFAVFLFSLNTSGQKAQEDSVKIDRVKIFAYCLDGNVAPVLEILKQYDPQKLSGKELKFKTAFETRFAGATDKSDYLETRKSPVTELLTIYRDYWRSSLLDNSRSYDTLLGEKLSAFFSSKYQLRLDKSNLLPVDTIDVYLKKYIASFGYHTTGFGKTGKYLDLLVWKNEKDTTYQFSFYAEKIRTPVVFMDDFITVGWEEYATLGIAYPGGWSTREALFCVRKAYDLKSEDFLISYLCHEGRHFMDYKLFPRLTSADLEYRAKLTELSLLKEELIETIELFINNANYESENGHSVANYCVIRDLSKALFKVDFEKDINKWKEVNAGKINKTAYDVLEANTLALKKQGAGVEKYIKK
jgi:hypothetical protein